MKKLESSYKNERKELQKIPLRTILKSLENRTMNHMFHAENGTVIGR